MKKIIFSTVLTLVFLSPIFAQSLAGGVNIVDMNSGRSLAFNGKTLTIGGDDANLYKNWKLTDSGKGYYTITNEKTGLCLGVSEALKGGVSQVIQSKNSGQADVQWQFTEIKEGSYKIQNIKNGLFLGSIPSLKELNPSSRIALCPDEKPYFGYIKWAVKPIVKIPIVQKGLVFNADGSVYRDGFLERTIENFNNPNYTVFFISRHAEKASNTDENTELSEEGKRRALRLATILKNIPIVKVGSTDVVRTKATAKPTADSKNLAVTLYITSMLNYINNCITVNGRGSKHLVIGHMDTVPTTIQQLTGQTPNYNSGGFDNLFVVVVPPTGNATYHLFKY